MRFFSFCWLILYFFFQKLHAEYGAVKDLSSKESKDGHVSGKVGKFDNSTLALPGIWSLLSYKPVCFFTGIFLIFCCTPTIFIVTHLYTRLLEDSRLITIHHMWFCYDHWYLIISITNWDTFCRYSRSSERK